MSMKRTMCEFVNGMSCKEVAEFMGKIVRCNSCKYYDERAASEVYANRHWCDELANYMPPNGFCSWGERRDS